MLTCEQKQERAAPGGGSGSGGDWSGAAAAGKETAKDWMDKGGKWLATARRKVAAAAKEASSSLQSRLDDLEVFKAGGGVQQGHPEQTFSAVH